MKPKDFYWEEFGIEELREEFACLEEVECDNQRILAEGGHHCLEKSTDAITSLINERDELRDALSRIREALVYPDAISGLCADKIAHEALAGEAGGMK